VLSEILVPRKTWSDPVGYDKSADKLAGLFKDNFAKYADGVSEQVRSAGPIGERSHEPGHV